MNPPYLATDEYLDEDDAPVSVSSGADYAAGDIIPESEILQGSKMLGYNPNPYSQGDDVAMPSSGPLDLMLDTVPAMAAYRGARYAGNLVAPSLKETMNPLAKWLADKAARAGGAITAGYGTEKIISPARAAPMSFAETIPNSLFGAIGGEAAQMIPDETLESGLQKMSAGLKESANQQRLKAITRDSIPRDSRVNVLASKPGADDFLQSENSLAVRVIEQDGGFAGAHSPKAIATRWNERVSTLTEQVDREIASADAMIRDSGGQINLNTPEVEGALLAIPSTFVTKEAKTAASELVEQFANRILNAKSLAELQQLKRDIFSATRFESNPEIEPAKNATLKKLGFFVRDLINEGYESALGKSVKTAEGEVFGISPLSKSGPDAVGVYPSRARSLLAELNEKDSAYLSLADEVGKMYDASSAPMLEKIVSSFRGSGLAKFLAISGAGFTQGIGGAVAAPIAYGVSRTPTAQMLTAGMKSGVADMLTAASPEAVRTLGAGLAGPVGQEVLGVGHGAPDAQAQNLPSLQMLTEGPVNFFPNGLPRDTSQWNDMALKTFALNTAKSPKAQIAFSMAQYLQAARKANDGEKARRIIADMAKLFPEQFEPGLGVDDMLFHADDQKEYLDMLESGRRSGSVSAIHLAKQRDAFLDKNNSKILPLDADIRQQAGRNPKLVDRLTSVVQEGLQMPASGPRPAPY